MWCRAVSTGLHNVNDWLTHLAHASSDTRLRADSMGTLPSGEELPTVGQWKAQSDVAMSIRGAEMRAIDAALTDYHRTGWIENYKKRLRAFLQVIKYTHLHLLTKHNNRTPALKHLARCIMRVVARRARTAAKPWFYAEFTHPLELVWEKDQIPPATEEVEETEELRMPREYVQARRG